MIFSNGKSSAIVRVQPASKDEVSVTFMKSMMNGIKIRFYKNYSHLYRLPSVLRT